MYISNAQTKCKQVLTYLKKTPDPPFMENSIKNFHFVFQNPSQNFSKPLTVNLIISSPPLRNAMGLDHLALITCCLQLMGYDSSPTLFESELCLIWDLGTESQIDSNEKVFF